jgi:hypothetical protein
MIQFHIASLKSAAIPMIIATIEVMRDAMTGVVSISELFNRNRIARKYNNPRVQITVRILIVSRSLLIAPQSII